MEQRGAGGQVRASFQDCLVRQLGFKEPEGNAICHLDGDKLVLREFSLNLYSHILSY